MPSLPSTIHGLARPCQERRWSLARGSAMTHSCFGSLSCLLAACTPHGQQRTGNVLRRSVVLGRHAQGHLERAKLRRDEEMARRPHKSVDGAHLWRRCVDASARSSRALPRADLPCKGDGAQRERERALLLRLLAAAAACCCWIVLIKQRGRSTAQHMCLRKVN